MSTLPGSSVVENLPGNTGDTDSILVPRRSPGGKSPGQRSLVGYSLSSVQLLSRVWLFVTARTGACQASLSITNSWSLLKLMSIESVMPSNHLILCRPLRLPPSVLPSIRVSSSESILHISVTVYRVTKRQAQLSMHAQYQKILKTKQEKRINYWINLSWYIKQLGWMSRESC